ncbi:MAG: hypothetical protein M1826_006811 [Phylliscum demangeonii]|nr:MAG: hypothetical protein M1826_006811 [Phylliscum demangeonii]
MEEMANSNGASSLPLSTPLRTSHGNNINGDQASTARPSPKPPSTPSLTTPKTVKEKGPAVKERMAMHREPREKKESLRKRESKGESLQTEARATPDRKVSQGTKRKAGGQDPLAESLVPLRYKLPAPLVSDYEPPRAPIFLFHHAIPHPDGSESEFYETSEHVYNRKGFRYTHCIADPTFPASLYYRPSETEPFQARFSFEDTSSHLCFDKLGGKVTTDKGFRMARANVGAREGRWYWECKILSGINRQSRMDLDPTSTDGGGGHVRMGWARREASLDAPVGFDAYSYGLRDVGGQVVHMSRPTDFFAAGDEVAEGDVIGLELVLPPLALHRRVVQGVYNPAVDLPGASGDEGGHAADIIRDKVPIRYKAHLYFEQFEYHATKELDELFNPSSAAAAAATAAPAATATGASSAAAAALAAARAPPNAGHALAPLRTLPRSYIRIYKNGRRIGTPFRNLLAFLPPASKPLMQAGARDGLDDGMLAYFPAVSVFRGGAAAVNFGPRWWCPPLDVDGADGDGGVDGGVDGDGGDVHVHRAPLQPMADRYPQQIAEDIVYDLVDEVDFGWQDGGGPHRAREARRRPGPELSELGRVGAGPAPLPLPPAVVPGSGASDGIKEVVQEEE